MVGDATVVVVVEVVVTTTVLDEVLVELLEVVLEVDVLVVFDVLVLLEVLVLFELLVVLVDVLVVLDVLELLDVLVLVDVLTVVDVLVVVPTVLDVVLVLVDEDVLEELVLVVTVVELDVLTVVLLDVVVDVLVVVVKFGSSSSATATSKSSVRSCSELVSPYVRHMSGLLIGYLVSSLAKQPFDGSVPPSYFESALSMQPSALAAVPFWRAFCSHLRSPVEYFDTQFFFPAEHRFVTSAGYPGSRAWTASST
jgi:hypothetical protein